MYEESTCILYLLTNNLDSVKILSKFFGVWLFLGKITGADWVGSRASIHIISAESWQFVSMYFHFTGTFRWVGNTFGKVVALGYFLVDLPLLLTGVFTDFYGVSLYILPMKMQ